MEEKHLDTITNLYLTGKSHEYLSSRAEEYFPKNYREVLAEIDAEYQGARIKKSKTDLTFALILWGGAVAILLVIFISAPFRLSIQASIVLFAVGLAFFKSYFVVWRDRNKFRTLTQSND